MAYCVCAPFGGHLQADATCLAQVETVARWFQIVMFWKQIARTDLYVSHQAVCLVHCAKWILVHNAVIVIQIANCNF